MCIHGRHTGGRVNISISSTMKLTNFLFVIDTIDPEGNLGKGPPPKQRQEP